MGNAALKSSQEGGVPPGVFSFSPYQKFVVAVLAVLQFTVILDFMILSPLGAMLMPAMRISPAEFGFVVSVYAFGAGISGFLTAGFADRFDRKKLLLFFYAGFTVGTLCCALAPSYYFLLIARAITGVFGGVVGSVLFAITTDLFPLQMRGRVMGVIQTSFAASQVLGIPFSLFLANHWGWHAPFLMVVVVGLGVLAVLWTKLQPIDAHLAHANRAPLRHLWSTISRPRYVLAFATTALLSTGGFLMMPFSSAYNVHNLGISFHDLPWIYMVTGAVSIVAGPWIGRMSDRVGKFRVFCFGSFLAIVTVSVYARIPGGSLWLVMGLSAIMFTGISSRMISSSALTSAIPDPESRGAFMSISASIQQVAGGVASIAGGLLVTQLDGGKIGHFDVLSNVVVVAMLITVGMMYWVHRLVGEPKRATF